MKNFNKKETFYFTCMTISMILADILVCFSDEVIQRIGLGFILAVVIFAILFYQEIKRSRDEKEKENIKKALK